MGYNRTANRIMCISLSLSLTLSIYLLKAVDVNEYNKNHEPPLRFAAFGSPEVTNSLHINHAKKYDGLDIVTPVIPLYA